MEISELPKGKKIILFDGVCNLCDSMVNYVIGRDKHDTFRFVPLQSELGKNIITYIGLAERNTDSIVLYDPEKAYYIKSGAALEIAKHLGWFSLGTLVKIVPRFLRDAVYDYVARNRYRWYGKKSECMLPTPELKNKFLE